jgi:anti-anti-sigma regulatory factor
MLAQTKINYSFEQNDNVGIFSFINEITSAQEDDLKIVLMRAVYSIDRAVLNFKRVSRIDRSCITLLRKAYCTSLRLKNPIILTEIPDKYISELFDCDDSQIGSFSFIKSRSLNILSKHPGTLKQGG